MTNYSYKALSADGETVKGVIEAVDEFEAVNKIKEKHGVVLKIEETKSTGKTGKIDLNEPLAADEKALSLTASQFAILLNAGLSASRTIEIISQQTTDKYLKRIFTEASADVAAGYSMSQSIEQHGKKIPATFIETMRAGEESGNLESSFDRLSKYYEKSYKLKAKVRSAMTYPAFLAVLAVIVIAVVVNVTVPVVAEVIYSAGGDLPAPTKILMSIYNFFRNSWPVILALIIAIVVAVKMYKKTEDGELNFARLSMKLPILGNINLMNAASQFANTMTTLLTSGLPITRAMTITGRVVDNCALGKSLAQAVTGLEEGKRLGDVLKNNEFLPDLLVEMATVGEESGSLEETLTTIGAYYDSEVEQATAKALGMLEPIITIVMGIVIGFIVIALYMPMFTMYNSM